MTSAAKKVAPVAQYEFRARPSSRITDKEALVVGRALLVIAEKHRIDDVRTIKPEQLLDEVERDPKHALRRYFEWNNSQAAKGYRLEQARKLIGSVSIVTIGDPRVPEVRQPMFVSTELSYTQDEKLAKVRTHGLLADVETRDDAFAASVRMHVMRIRDAVRGLETLTRSGPKVRGIVALKKKVRAAVDEYFAGIE